MMIDEALEHLVKGIVDNPEEVVISEKEGRRGTTLEVRVHPEDIGKVIGRNGRTAKALRLLSQPWLAAAFALISSRRMKRVNRAQSSCYSL